ncbi:MAG TPA: AI-2E family transporter, partial [Thermoleophilaceae bacterium]|nr:AI-2E family transporter [Thermoleophilaceae bacterium]
MQPRESLSRVVVRTVLIIVAVAIALYVIYLVRKPISWLLIAAFLAVALSGPVNLLSNHMKRGFAITIVFLGMLLLPLSIGALVLPPIVNGTDDLARNAPQYANDVADFVRDDPRLKRVNEDYDITAKLEDEAAKLPGRLGDAATVLRDVGFGIVNSIFAVVTILIM